MLRSKISWLILAVVGVTVLFGDSMLFRAVLHPLSQLQTAVHEMGHAVTCIMTGGSVNGLTIVPNGQGAAGVTSCSGGIPLVYLQAGYLFETIFTCLLIILARHSTYGRKALIVLGIAIGLTTLIFMPGAIVNLGQSAQGSASILWGIVISAALVFAGVKLSDRWAFFLVIFMAAQSVLCTLTSHVVLLEASLRSAGMSDAHLLARAIGLPAIFWAVLWAAFGAFAIWRSFRYATSYKPAPKAQ